MRDPYTVLGVAKTADTAEIKKAFRKLAKKFHPDSSSDPKAKEKFAEVSAAYEILGDEKKRGAFDRGEIDAEGKPRFQGFEGFGAGGPGGAWTRRSGPGGFEQHEFSSGEDVGAQVTVTLTEAAHGAKVRVTLPTERTLEVSIPAGMEDGKQIRLKGQGHPSPFGGESGDALITVKIARHPYFRVEGRDLRLDLPVALYEAVLGAKVNVPTLNGMVELNVPAGSNGGRTLRLRGKGLPGGGGAVAGDLLVTLRIMLPDDPDPDLVSLMRQWQSQTPYDPRRDLK